MSNTAIQVCFLSVCQIRMCFAATARLALCMCYHTRWQVLDSVSDLIKYASFACLTLPCRCALCVCLQFKGVCLDIKTESVLPSKKFLQQPHDLHSHVFRRPMASSGFGL